MIGFRLKQERVRLGLTQPDLARVVGVSKRTVVDWEQGKTSPTATQLKTLMDNQFDVLYIVTDMRADNYFNEVEARLDQESLPITPQHLEVYPELRVMRQKLEAIWREPTSTPENSSRAELFLRLAFRHPDAVQVASRRQKNVQQLMNKCEEALNEAQTAVGWTPPLFVQQAILTAMFSYGLTPDGATAVLQMLQSQAKQDGIWGYSKPVKEVKSS